MKSSGRMKKGPPPLEFKKQVEDLLKNASDTATSNVGAIAAKKELARRSSITNLASLAVPVANDDSRLSPEIAGLGRRVRGAVCGRAATMPEKAGSLKELAFLGVANLEELNDDYGVDVRSIAGMSPEHLRTNQDDLFVATTADHYVFYGVFDGHGGEGTGVAAISRNAILRTLLTNIPYSTNMKKRASDAVVHGVLKKAFAVANDILITEDIDLPDARLSGAAAVVVVHDIAMKKMHVAWTGNCRAVLAQIREFKPDEHASKRRKKKVNIVAMNTEHITTTLEERARIHHAGGELRPSQHEGFPDEIYFKGEDWPGIPLTRCIGNFLAQTVGVTCEAEVATVSLNGTPKYLILASDGILDMLSEKSIFNTLGRHDKDNLHFAVEEVLTHHKKACQHLLHGGALDDATIIAVNLCEHRHEHHDVSSKA